MNKRRRQIFDDMRHSLYQGVTTMDDCDCGRRKRSDLSKCICCLADELRVVEKEEENGTN